MNIVKRITDLGTNKQTDPVYNKHIRFTNSVALFVCFFIVQNAALAFFYNQPLLLLVYMLHFISIALVPVFSYRGKRVLASAWFSSVAILFVTFYSIEFNLASYNFVFLPMIVFLQFFLFSATEKKQIIIFTVITIICFAGAIVWQELQMRLLIPVPKGLLEAQRWNSLIGIPFLSIAFGIYAHSTIHDAEQEVAREKEKTEQLLLNNLPQAVAERFKNDQSYLAEGYPSVSVLFADIVGFTRFSEKVAPDDLVQFLNEVFSKFDSLTEAFGLEKIKTIGDAYMVAGGVPVPSDNHLQRVCRMAIKIQEVIQEIKSPDGEPLRMRVGISTGPVTAGVIGVKKFIYDLWGDTVNTASRMESLAEGGSIQITGDVYEIIKNEFDCIARGTIQVKGKGAMATYLLIGAKA
ncbi:adenylate/guanylate cyclase domain-containing protein [Pontibacter pamirensis]|uniref:adenylate/guanylate cyclase domain-containing protein n=1 Tax=Pontibacter pamirensis TaxID=2562824 RepID=UPI001389DE9A|nr:adenylate/guanylate cyclase domain-containing protein [Pontibacter pamirensis]